MISECKIKCYAKGLAYFTIGKFIFVQNKKKQFINQ